MGEIADEHQSYIADDLALMAAYGTDDYNEAYHLDRSLCGMPLVRGVDPRAQATDKLPAPGPLPYVSRRALARVKDRLPAPTRCNCCDGMVELVSNAEIYHGREYGDWPYAYLCRGCGAYVGLHPNTDVPLGTLADKPTREARKSAKAVFMSLVGHLFKGDRTAGYAWLAAGMRIDPRRCHFGMFTVEQCAQAITFMNREAP